MILLPEITAFIVIIELQRNTKSTMLDTPGAVLSSERIHTALYVAHAT